MTNQSIAELVAYLNSLDVQLSIEGDLNGSIDEIRLRCNAPEGTLTTELRRELVERKPELISYLQLVHRKTLEKPLQPELVRLTSQETGFPLSFAQQRLWFLYQLAPDNPFYNVPTAIRLTGTLDQSALKRSFDEIVRRHAALRTTFTTVDGQPVQIVASDVKVDFSIVNLPKVALEDSTKREQIVQQLATAEAQRPFNLTIDPLLRVTVLQFDSTEAVLLLTMHHIIADGWSLGVLVRELAYFYRAFVQSEPPQLPPLPIQYTDFVRWQRNWLQGEILEKQLGYWRKQLQDLSILNLPSDRPRPAAQTYRGATYPLQFSPELTQKLETLSQQAGASLFMSLLAAFQTLLYRYTGQEDIAIGVPIANRHQGEVEGLIGFFVNSLVMRSSLSKNLTFRELLEQVRRTALEAYEHQDLPFEKLVEEIDPDRDLSRNPLFQVAFALQNAPMQPLELSGLKLEPVPQASGSTRFDLEMHLWEPTHGLRSLWQSQKGLSGFISYSTDLFDRDRIARLVGHFQTLLEGIVANPDAHLADLSLLTTAEGHQILAEWNQTGREPLQDCCFHQIFEAQAQSTPDQLAVVSEQETLTYQELNQRAGNLAQVLRQLRVRADSLVGLCVDRSADMVVGILGILKAGGAYVPIDPNYPSDRLQFMLTDTQVSLLLTQSWLVESLPASPAKVLCLDHPLTPHLDYFELSFPTPDSLAYVIYTSGSTGTPKGVLLSHQGLCNVVQAQQHVFDLSRTSRILQFSSLSFDASIFEIALAFGCGGTLYIPPKFAQLPGMALVQFLEDNAITHALLTPAVLAVLPSAELPALKVLITGGEACSSQVVDLWAVDRRFFNAYGPTETTIWATVSELRPGDHPQMIGRPILNTQVYVLDANLNPMPVGIPGELYIGGAGIARGYLNRPELTADQFLRTKYGTLYKTGDRACYHANGTLEFLGRVDHQIKIRGFRVELGEIEATLQRYPVIEDAVITTSSTATNEMRLIAYFSLKYYHFQQAQWLQTQQLQHWQTLYNQTYQASDHPHAFNITGWNSSYTGEPFPLEQMQEWVSDRVQQILALKPKRVLEIGCGTGLLLFQLAPHCQKYVGTDFSSVALESIQKQLDNLPQVELLHRTATDFEGIDAASFDVVILNSIVQYFPNVDYLVQVIQGALQTVAPGGVLFLGDVRNFSLLNAFHTWLQFSQADADIKCSHLQQLIQRSQFEEPELTIDPTFFYALCNQFDQIQQVQIRLSRGHFHNEMTQFRYNVVLQVKDPSAQQESRSPHSIQDYDWKLCPIEIEKIYQKIIETEPDLLIIRNVSNRRVIAAVELTNWLNKGEAPKTVGQMREALQKAVEVAIDPQDWWNLEASLPYTVEITWSRETHTGSYDVRLIRHGIHAEVGFPIAQSPSSGWHHYTNNPLQSQFARQLVPELRKFLGQSLPDYMLPSAFVPLETLPLTANGKVDRHALPAFDQDLTYFVKTEQNRTIVSVTQTESTLLEIWQDLLRLKHITRYDNFFELGGHSLLATQMTSRVRDAFGLELPLKSVFEAPTIAQLAPILESLRSTTTNPKIPPIVRLDRSAYRRQRSTLASSTESVVNNVPASLIQGSQKIASDTESWSPLVPLTLGTSNHSFFCVHPMFGVVFPYLELANSLDSHCSFYGLQPLGLDGKAPPLNRIEAIAAYYVKAIQTLQPQGPYFLGGWSFGGLVAFEMAQQLTRSGEKIELLAILDTPAPCNKPSFYQNLKFLLGTALWSTLPWLLDYSSLVAGRLQSWNSWVSRWQWSTIVRSIPEESRLRLLDESAFSPMLRIVYANAHAAYRYVPQHYPNRVTLFKAIEQSTPQDSTLGWGTLAADVDLHQVPGNHLSLLKSPHVQTLAQQLGRYL